MPHTRKLRKNRAATKSARPKRRTVGVPRSAKQFFAKSPEAQDTWNRAVHAVTKMRADRRVTLTTAAREFDLDPQVVRRLAGSALRKRSNGRYVAKAKDRLLRVLVVPTKDRLCEVATTNSVLASRLAQHSAKVQRFLQTGEGGEAIERSRRVRLRDVKGKEVRLLTDLKELKRQGSAGVLSFESMYARSA